MNANDLIAWFHSEEDGDNDGRMDGRHGSDLDFATGCTVHVSWIAYEQVGTTVQSLNG